MNKLLIVSGPTATGKTALAVKLAKKFNGELISADSRQIYQDMNIGTGKDHPGDLKIHLIDIINPNQSFSVAQYCQLALEKIKKIKSKNKLPIIVGGTGQYIDSIINPQPTFSIKPNKILRFFLNKFSTFHLQKLYAFLDLKSFLLLNNSEKNNPHRLIRKIEIYFFRRDSINAVPIPNFNILHLSLTAPNDFLYQKIDQRVQTRLNNGLFVEIENLLKKYHWSDPGLNTLAYKEFKTGFTPENINRWRFDEHRLARRQKTWFKSQSSITFLDITRPDFCQQAITLVQKWYNLL